MKEIINTQRTQELCEYIVLNYLKKIGQNPNAIYCIDIVGLLKDYFGIKIDYETFAEPDPGRDGFHGDGIHTLKVRRQGKVEDWLVPEKHIVVDKVLRNPRYSVMLRLVLAHEAGHLIYNKISPETVKSPFYTDFANDGTKYSLEYMKSMWNFGETGATNFGCALLQPRFLLVDTLHRVMKADVFNIYAENQLLPKESMGLFEIANQMGVSETMLLRALKEHKLVRQGTMEEYCKLVNL